MDKHFYFLDNFSGHRLCDRDKQQVRTGRDLNLVCVEIYLIIS